ncbi:hypothetical protein OLD66_08025, partial [Streptococcus pneumoniae]|nr:hypothetical protein [Streptococcus pneumoniae]
KFGDREREACDKKNCIRNNHSKSPHSNFGQGEREDSNYKKKALRSHQGDYTNIETEVKVWKKQHTRI